MQRTVITISQNQKYMKKYLFVALTLPIVVFACSRKVTGGEKPGYVEGKVLRTSCASMVIQVTNNDSLGEDGWKDMTQNNASVDNVFAVNNKCKVSSDVKAGATLRFKISTAEQNDCVVCMMYDGPPKTQYDLKDITVVTNK
jgi:hypothetical protein